MKDKMNDMSCDDAEYMRQGHDNEDISMTIKPGGVETPRLAMPTEKTQDKPTNQDGGKGKPFFKTLESRRGKSDSGDNYGTGGYGGPNSR